MNPSYLHICHAVLHHEGYAWPLMTGGFIGCTVHCASVCLLCVSSGAGVGIGFATACRDVARHLLPALIGLGALTLPFSSSGGLV